MLIYLSYPNSDNKFTIEIGVTEDGFTYEGDSCSINDYKEIPVEEGLRILETYRQLINNASQLEHILLTNKLDKNIVDITIK